MIEDLRDYLILDIDNILVKKYDENNFKLVVIDSIADNNQIQFLEYSKSLGIKRFARKMGFIYNKIAKNFP